MTKRLVLLIGVFFSMLLSTQAVAGSVVDSRAVKPKVLFFSAIDINYLRDSIRQWGEGVGTNGFMLSYIADWWTPKEKLFENLEVLRGVNLRGANYGIDSNFIKVALGYKVLPNWTDDRAWAEVLHNFKNIAVLIKESRTKGIAIDSEPNEAPLFDSKAERFKSISKDILRAKIYQRGKEIMQVLTEAFPDIEVTILPDGAYYRFTPYDEPTPNAYEMWIDLFNGMASVKNKNGIVVASERTYDTVEKGTLINTYDLLNKTMQYNVQDLLFWKDKCSIAIGMWPLGKTYSDKSARYSLSAFQEQLLQAVKLSPKYVWIYDHGAAWFQLKREEVDKYTINGRWIWGKDYQMLPTVSEISKYYSIVRGITSKTIIIRK